MPLMPDIMPLMPDLICFQLSYTMHTQVPWVFLSPTSGKREYNPIMGQAVMAECK